jgi:hypothetical protein
VSAFARSLEGSITLRDVKENLRGIDPTPPAEGGDGKDKKKESDQKKPKPGPPGKSV